MANKRIMVVEDENIVAQDIQSTLEGLGYDVTCVVSTGEDAIKMASEVNPDLILMDIMLKGNIDGVDAAEQIRNRFSLPVVYLTAYTDENTLKRAKITEPYAYILKPFEPRELHVNIEMAIYKHKMEEKVRRHNEELEELVKKRTKKIQQLEKQRSEIEKLAATGRIAAIIAHEINNPIAGIKNSALLVKDAVPKDHKYYKYVEKIEKEVDRVSEIIRRTFDMYKPLHENPHKFDVVEVIRDVMAMLEENGNGNEVALGLDTCNTSIIVVMSENLLRQVLHNIIQNAIHVSPKGGEVKIAISKVNDLLTIMVADQGPGIPDELRLRIFEPFFTTKSGKSSGGLGLGLAISKGIAETMGGSIKFRSEKDKGTVFTIEFPIGVE